MNHPLHGICIVLVYVDDILIVSDSVKWIESAKRAIGDEFRMKDFGEAKFILGMDIVRNKEAGTISLSISRNNSVGTISRNNTRRKSPRITACWTARPRRCPWHLRIIETGKLHPIRTRWS
jgi:hypothetical protein